MNLNEILPYFHGVRGHGSQYMATCPCHEDKRQSLSIGEGHTGVVIKCMAGCDTRAVLAQVGLRPRDLFYDQEQRPSPGGCISHTSGQQEPVAVYQYPEGVQKLRYADKRFAWRRPDGTGGWVYDRKGVAPALYAPQGLKETLFLVEGEKDVDTMLALGYPAASGPDGAGHGKWRPEFTQALAGRNVYILPDNDTVGRDYAQEVAQALHGTAQRVYLLDIRAVWPEAPEHGDISDLHQAVGDGIYDRVTQLIEQKPWSPPGPEARFHGLIKTLDEFEEQEAQWLVPGWLPQGQIVLLAADGGVGKTSLWCHILAAVSAGRPCLLDPEGYQRPAQRVMFLTSEDSVRIKLKKKLRQAGAYERNVSLPDFNGDEGQLMSSLKFGTKDFADLIEGWQPALCVIDPIQAFIPPNVNMGARNAMRACLAPLIPLGEKFGTTFLLVCHTNKRVGAAARGRVSDSADLWDIARSVLMAGYTQEEGIRYLSNEKNNYDCLQRTILFSMDEEGLPQWEGTSPKRDRDYNQETFVANSAPKRDDCKRWLLDTLTQAGGSLANKDLEAAASDAGFSKTTFRRVKEEMKRNGQLQYVSTGDPAHKVWNVQLMEACPLAS
jgi:RecA-family ATPase